MNNIRLHDKRFKPYIQKVKIRQAVLRLAEQINRDYTGRNPFFLIILNGSFIFAADLLREIKLDCEISFIKLSSYQGTSSMGHVHQLIGLSENLSGKEVIIIEDIVDSGNTLEFLHEEINKHKPASLKTASLLFKPQAYTKTFKIDYTGIEIPNDFIVGYGLDYNGLGRNLEEIYVIMED